MNAFNKRFFGLLFISKFIINFTSGLTQPNRVISSVRIANCLEFILKVILFFRLLTIRLGPGACYLKLTHDTIEKCVVVLCDTY
jgi:hypothetical protein